MGTPKNGETEGCLDKQQHKLNELIHSTIRKYPHTVKLKSWPTKKSEPSNVPDSEKIASHSILPLGNSTKTGFHGFPVPANSQAANLATSAKIQPQASAYPLSS